MQGFAAQLTRTLVRAQPAKPVIDRSAKMRPETVEEKSLSLLNLLKLTGRTMTVYQLSEACEFSETTVRMLVKHLKKKSEVEVISGDWVSVPRQVQ
jgi:hypothetical protein